MLKKLVIIIFCLLLLDGCTTYSQESLTSSLDEYFSNTLDPLEVRTNNTLSKYSFYLPSDMTFDECIDDSIVLNYSNSKIILNINIYSLISKSYYRSSGLKDDGFFIEDRIIYQNTGSYLNIDELVTNYFIKIYDGDPYYLIHLMSDELNLYAYCFKEEAVETAKHMMLLSRSTRINVADIVDEYSSNEVISYERKQVDLFQYVIPKTGYLIDLLNEPK